jgi:hypothetical protein
VTQEDYQEHHGRIEIWKVIVSLTLNPRGLSCTPSYLVFLLHPYLIAPVQNHSQIFLSNGMKGLIKRLFIVIVSPLKIECFIFFNFPYPATLLFWVYNKKGGDE